MLASKNSRMEEEDISKQELNWGFQKNLSSLPRPTRDEGQELYQGEGFCLHLFEQQNINKNQ